MKISMDKKYKTVDGKPVQIISISGRSPFPVVGYIGGSNVPLCWQEDGRYDSGFIAKNDLVEGSPYADFKEDDPVMVRDKGGDPWQRRHFAYEEGGRAYCYKNGASSWTGLMVCCISWNECRKPTEEELNNA